MAGPQDAIDTMARYFENIYAGNHIQKSTYDSNLSLEIDLPIPFRYYNCNQTASRAKSSGR